MAGGFGRFPAQAEQAAGGHDDVLLHVDPRPGPARWVQDQIGQGVRGARPRRGIARVARRGGLGAAVETA